MSRSVGQPGGSGERRLFLTDEEPFANLHVWKKPAAGVPGEKLWDGEIEGQRVQVWVSPGIRRT